MSLAAGAVKQRQLDFTASQEEALFSIRREQNLSWLMQIQGVCWMQSALTMKYVFR